MSWVSFLFLYVLIWWLVLFTQLSSGAGEKGKQGTDESGAPLKPAMWHRLGRTSLISAAILFVIWVVAITGWFSLFEILTGREL